MELKLSHCFLAVDDHDKALGFYRDVLGFDVRTDVAFEGMRWVTVSPPSQPEVEIPATCCASPSRAAASPVVIREPRRAAGPRPARGT